MTREDSRRKVNKDLYVEHADGDLENHKLDNLVTICFKCHNNKYLEAARERVNATYNKNLLKVLETIKQYNVECHKSIDIKTLVLLLGGDLGSQAIDRHLKYLLNTGKIKQRYGNYIVSEKNLEQFLG